MATLSSSSSPVPAALLHSFFTEATNELNDVNYSSSSSSSKSSISSSSSSSNSNLSKNAKKESIDDHRKSLLRIQQRVLHRVVSNFDGIHESQVLQVLQRMGDGSSSNNNNGTTTTTASATTADISPLMMDTSLQEPLEAMTTAARQALARVVLQQEFCQHQNNGNSNSKQQQSSPSPSPMISVTPKEDLNRSDILDFCGLCQAVVLLPEVLAFLVATQKTTTKAAAEEDGLVLYDHFITKRMPFPHERLEYIQQAIYRALGYPNEVSSKQLEQFMKSHERDDELQRVFKETITKLRVVMTNASLQVQQAQLSDFEEGGVTRVISVSYSESVNGDVGNNNGSNAPPTTESMRQNESSSATQQQQQQTMHMARQTAALEQTLLAQLLQMDPAERDVQLEQAQRVQRDLMEQLASLPPGPERVQCMTTLPKEHQQLLLLHKLWQGLLDRNGGRAPSMVAA